MPRILRLELIVGDDAIDAFGHVNNQRYVAWMQDVASAHSAANGWPMERYLATGAAWVVRSHFIEYLRPAFARDTIEIVTWAANLALREVARKYLFRRASDRRILACAETKWVYVDIASGRPKRIPEELLNSFEAVPEGDPELGALGREAHLAFIRIGLVRLAGSCSSWVSERVDGQVRNFRRRLSSLSPSPPLGGDLAARRRVSALALSSFG